MKRALAPCLAVGALVVAGCGGGGDDKADYEKEVRAAGQALEKAFGDIGSSVSGSASAGEAATKLEEGAEALDKAASDLDGVDPPSEVKAPHDDVVDALGELADEFHSGAEAAKSNNVEALLKFTTGLQSSASVKKLTEAGQKFEKEGYDFGN